MPSRKTTKPRLLTGILSLALIPAFAFATDTQPTSQPAKAAFLADHEYTIVEVVKESVFGDVYANPERWQELSISNFFQQRLGQALGKPSNWRRWRATSRMAECL